MKRFSLAITCLLAAGALTAPAQDTVELDLVVNDQIRKVVILLNNEAAPQTCENFRKLAQSGFYKGMAVHRAIPNYVVQMGDPYTKDSSQRELWGTGGPDYTIPAEIKLPHIRGAVAMARLPDSRNSSRASNGSQFYIALDDLDNLNGQYTVFGRVTRGIEHLDFISEQTVDTNDVPINPITIGSTSVGGSKAAPDVFTPVASAATGAVRSVGNSINGESAGKMLGAAGDGVRNAGEMVAGVMPKFGRGEDQPSGDGAVPEIPVTEAPVDEIEDELKEKRNWIPRPDLSGISMPKVGFGRSKDAPAEEAAAPVEAPAESTTLAPAIRAAVISEDQIAAPPEEKELSKREKKKMSIPVPEKTEEPDGRINRMIKRIW